MRKIYLSLLWLLCISFQIGAAGLQFEQEMPSIKDILITGNIQVEIIPASKNIAKFSAVGFEREDITVLNESGKLKISTPIASWVQSDKELKVTIYTNGFQSIKCTKGAVLHIQKPLQNANVTLKVSDGSEIYSTIQGGNIICNGLSDGLIVLKGQCDQLSANFSLGSTLSAYDLKTKSANVTAKSKATLKIYVLENMQAVAKGYGHIIYKGNPKSKSSDTGLGGKIQAY